MSSDSHFIIGAGPVGRHLAEQLAARGSEVTLATRSGTSTGIAGVRHLRLDASDVESLTTASTGASFLYNCANPGSYSSWQTVWPPLAAAMLSAAERAGAVYVITGNLYPYGPVDEPMHEGMADHAKDHKGKLRARMWADAKVAHDSGRVRAVEVRSSDYVGRGVGKNGHISRVVPAALRGKRVVMIGDVDQPHTFTEVRDCARMLVAVAADESAHGRTWITPSNPARSQRETLSDVLISAGKRPVPITALNGVTFAAASLFSPMLRELRELNYQWTSPYLIDDRAAREHFKFEPTPWHEVCLRTAQLD